MINFTTMKRLFYSFPLQNFDELCLKNVVLALLYFITDTSLDIIQVSTR